MNDPHEKAKFEAKFKEDPTAAVKEFYKASDTDNDKEEQKDEKN